MMQKLDPDKLPPAVRAAYDRAMVWTAERFRGRRVVPRPMVLSLPIPELGEDARLHAIIVLPLGTGREAIERARIAAAAKKDRPIEFMAAIEEAASKALVEMCVYVEGMPEDGEDPRVTARDSLKELRQEAGALGAAYDAIGAACLSALSMPEVTLGKL